MGFIRKIVTLNAVRSRRIKALIDTGADKNYISRRLQKIIGATGYGRMKQMTEYVLPNGKIVKSENVYFTIVIDGKPFETYAIVLENKKIEFIIGVNFLQKNSIQIMGERLILPKFPVLKIHRI